MLGLPIEFTISTKFPESKFGKSVSMRTPTVVHVIPHVGKGGAYHMHIIDNPFTQMEYIHISHTCMACDKLPNLQSGLWNSYPLTKVF